MTPIVIGSTTQIVIAGAVWARCWVGSLEESRVQIAILAHDAGLVD
jgi:hypothetical protein